MKLPSSNRWTRAATAVALALSTLALGSCTDAIRGAPDGAFIDVVINPPFIVAHGGVAIVTAIVTEAAGTPVSDGTVVQFFTTLGKIDEQVKTKGGIARANLVADSRSGTAEITVVSGGILPDNCTEDCKVTIGSALPKTVVLIADPASIGSGRTSYLTANVFDEFGNPVANVPVLFEITEKSNRDALESGGRQRFTDTNGQAFDIFYSSQAPASRSVGVTANAPNQVKDSITIQVN